MTQQFQVFPHGVYRENEASPVFAVFKMILSIDTEYSGAITYEEWKDFLEGANKNTWRYEIKDNKLVIGIDTSLKKNVQFFRRDYDAKEDNLYTSEKPGFGYDFNSDEAGTMWAFMEKGRRYFDMNATVHEQASTRQFDDTTNSYNEVLQAANAYASPSENNSLYEVPAYYNENASRYSEALKSNVRQKSRSKDTLNFRAILSQILDEPIVAERMGLIREFRIDINELPKGNYTISMKEKKPGGEEEEYLLQCLTLQQEKKYYHGLNKYTLPASEFAGVEIFHHDSYKALEAEKPHADGIYVKVKYRDNSGNIYDPFDSSDFIGFNALLEEKFDNNSPTKFWSLSAHKKTIKLHGFPSIIADNTSGVFTPRADIMTANNIGYRNSILLTYRGDNLQVNRTLRRKSEKDENSSFTSDSEFCREENLVRDEIFKKTDELIDGTQKQLNIGDCYNLYLRTVTPAHYYFMSADEIPPSARSYTLSFNELFKSATDIFSEINFNPGLSALPIKSPQCIGKKRFIDMNDKYVDNTNHLVLDRIKNEREETRFIYPPAIKIEDFRLLKFMLPQAMKTIKNGHLEPINKPQYIRRCVAIEDREQNKLPSFALRRKRIKYLADPRAKATYLVPADLNTSLRFSPMICSNYIVSNQYPFFDDLLATEFEVVRNGNTSSFKFNDVVHDSHDNIEDGIYNFNLYCVDEHFVKYIETLGEDERLTSLDHYNAIPLKISIVNKPATPLFPKPQPDKVLRKEDNSNTLNNWYSKIQLQNSSQTWKSIKYLEETTVLRLQHDGLDKIYKRYHKNNPTMPDLMKSEYPYEMFLSTEGSIDNNEGLRTDLIPDNISINVQLSAHAYNHLSYNWKNTATGTNLICKIILNGKQTLSIVLSDTPEMVMYLNEAELAKDSSFNLIIGLDKDDLIYKLYLTPSSKGIALLEPPKPEISAADLEVPEDVLRTIILDRYSQLIFKRSNSFCFFSDLKTPFSREKKVKLFASSIYQPYYPNEVSEFPLGSYGSIFNIKIPNNAVPKKPELDAEILLKHQISNIRLAKDGNREQSHTAEHLLRLLLPQDFMDEGKNTLAIVIRKNDEIVNNGEVSLIGEDITKLTDRNWTGIDLKALIDFNTPHSVLKKYFAKEVSTCYKQKGSDDIYEVVEFTPFYNTELRKWQVIIPFIPFDITETMFMKLVALKIAPGHGLEPIGNNSYNHPYIDSTGTNISAFSTPVQLPVYSQKSIAVEYADEHYIIKIKSQSKHSKKLYFVMLYKNKTGHSLVNVHMLNENTQPQDLVQFKVNGKPQLIHKFTGATEVAISKEKCASIVVLEFEQHDNFNEPQGEYNPLYETTGLRLINIAEFEK